jgi:serine/threonine protein kinase
LYLTGHSRTIATNKSLGNFQAMLSSLKQVLLKTYNIAYGESSSSKNVTQSAYLPEEARRRKAVTSRSASYPEPARATGYTKGNLNMFFQNMKIRVVVTHRVVGDSLEDFFRKLRNKPIIDSVLFQLLFTIHTLNQLGIQHNDLHAGNILVDLYPEADTGQYFIDGNVYEVPLPVKIYLFDFDQSSTAYCGPNKYLDEEYYSHFDKQRQEAMYETICTKNGICNERNLKFDMYTVIRNILGLTAIKWDDVADSLRVLIPEVNEEYPNRFYSPKYKSPGEPTEVASIEKVIEELFSKWKY